MLGSRYVIGIREEIEVWDKKLTQLQDLLDEWVKCSRDASEQQEVQKRLEDYFETKRVKLPRFYFLSNDVVLQMLDQTAKARQFQPFMNKCFDSINALTFASEATITGEKNSDDEPINDPSPTLTPSGTNTYKVPLEKPDYVTTMISVENEYVQLTEPVYTHLPVETWLLKFESEMKNLVNFVIRQALDAFTHMKRTKRFFKCPALAILTVDQITWTLGCTNALDAKKTGVNQKDLEEFLDKNKKDLQETVILVNGQLASLERAAVNTLIIVGVHARDIVETLVKEKYSSSDAFELM
ncbi:MAG: putative dynein heavy chain [Streblomastix strix]|uniref:Putative dynein heavy chain n=1 Tax=Streblomastix strix TaxID=222440 RepID=A0A5J4TIV5_9EUKA|nr:MAG: putative dynein heavy chain [Streblomastix strix]